MELELDTNLEDTLSRRAAEHGFDSQEEYVTDLLNTVVEELEAIESRQKGSAADGTDNDIISNRLRDLGYLE